MNPGNPRVLREVYDMMIIFPYVEHSKAGKRTYKLETFQRTMLGLNKKHQMNRYKAVFRTPRCRNSVFRGNFNAKKPRKRRLTRSANYDIVEHLEEDRSYIKEWKEALRIEWNARIAELRGDTLKQESDDTEDTLANEHEYCVVVAKSIAQRLQLTCGLTTHMFKSYNNTELFLAVKADSGDLREEAVRMKYLLHLRQRPFTSYNVREEQNWNEHIYSAETAEAAEQHLYTVMEELDPRSESEKIRAELDPLLFHAEDKDKGEGKGTNEQKSPVTNSLKSSRKGSLVFLTNTEAGEHQSLRQALKLWGHHPESDSQGFSSQEEDDSWITEFLEQLRVGSWIKQLFYLNPSDRDIFFSPHAEYSAEPKYQHYYRKYPVDSNGTALTNSAAFGAASQSNMLKGPILTGEKQGVCRNPFNKGCSQEVGGRVTANCCTLFRDVDRIRLVSSIINRHLNMQALKFSRRVKDYYGLHNEREISRLKDEVVGIIDV